jgi:transmembrane sensor
LLQYDEAALTGLKVSGVLPLDDIDWALKALAGSQPIEVRRYTPWVIRVTRKQ